MEDYEDFFRQRLTDLRLQKGVSEYQMSMALGKSKGYIQQISSGRALPQMKMFFEICDYLEVTPLEFLPRRTGSRAWSEIWRERHSLWSPKRSRRSLPLWSFSGDTHPGG